MRTLLIFLCSALAVCAQTFIRSAAFRGAASFQGTPAAAPPSGYAFREGFEGTNNPLASCDLTGWTAEGSAASAYTTAPLKGSKSLRMTGTDNSYFYRSVAGNTQHYYWTWKGISAMSGKRIAMLPLTNHYDQSSDSWTIYSDGSIFALLMGGTQIGSDYTSIYTNQYHFWVDFTIDTQFDLYISTNATKPGSPTIAASAAQVPNWAPVYFTFPCVDTSSGFSYIVDDWITNSTAIGSNP